MTTAKSGDTVRIHYTGKLTDGTQFDSSEGRAPLEFTLGSGHVIPGMETGVTGLAIGDKKTIEIASPDAYGAHDPQGIQIVPREHLPKDMELQIGMHLGAKTPAGEQVSFIVTALSETEVTMDGNHPLAGKDLVFDVELVGIV